jgi:hypothetical protein
MRVANKPSSAGGFLHPVGLVCWHSLLAPKRSVRAGNPCQGRRTT